MALRTVERFDEAHNTWSLLPPMPTRRRGLAAVSLRGRIYAIGGGHAASTGLATRTSSISPRTQACGTVERYDVATGVWERMPPMPTPRMFLAAVVLNGRVYAIGGSDGAQALRTVECFDEETNSWDKLPEMPTRRVFFSAGVLHG
mmetsp:Transcript_61622/g.112246  ORF Transcript_61622/g.112246 Transcript_61622/m.112246 type:complete len:146 (+) Transcript_61622:2-439(+)